jgi:hypothetical protein
MSLNLPTSGGRPGTADSPAARQIHLAFLSWSRHDSGWASSRRCLAATRVMRENLIQIMIYGSPIRVMDRLAGFREFLDGLVVPFLRGLPTSRYRPIE